MKRSASLDFLRGAAAFAVAIPHYLTANAPFQPFAEAFAIAGVEVFFVLSGFVLAPQIVDWVVGKPWRNLGVFLVRRWMRTIPPYVVALVVIAVADRQPHDRRFRALSLLCREPFFLRQPCRFLSRRLEPRGRGMVLCAVRSRPVPGRKAARKTRPAVRGDLRGSGHSRLRGAAARVRAARLGPERPAGHALSHRLDRLGLFALSRARASSADCAWTPPPADGAWARCSRCLRSRSRRARRRHPGRRRRRPRLSSRFPTSRRRSA